MTADRNYPNAAVRLAAEALTAEGLLNNAGYIAGDERRAAKVVLAAAWPVIEQRILREAAKRILLLPGLSSGLLCPQCHGRHVVGPHSLNPAYWAERFTCQKGHEWDKPDGPRLTTESLLRLMARGEPLPDLPPKGITDGA